MATKSKLSFASVQKEMREHYLNNLEEPILIVGHVLPDADVISSAACLLNYFDDIQKESYYVHVGPIPKELEWCISKDKIKSLDEDGNPSLDYKSLIVVDTNDSELRVGFKQKDVKTLVFEHHASSEKLAKENPNKYIFFDCPSTSSIFSQAFGINDPIIYVGLFFDAIYHNNRMIDCAKILIDLYHGGLTHEKIAEYHGLLERKKDVEIIDCLRNAYLSSYSFDELGAVLGVISADFPVEYKHEMTTMFREYFDGLLIVNRRNNLVSIRFEKKFPLSAMKFAELYGGGGHHYAAGLTIPEDVSLSDFQSHFVKWVTDEISSLKKD